MTRKLAALALAALPALAGARDLPPGTFEVGGSTNLSFGSAKVEVNDNKVLDTSARSFTGDALGYVTRNVGLGLGLSYGYSKVELASGSSSESTQWLVAPEVKVSVPLAPTASLLLVGAVGRAKVDVDGTETTGWEWLARGGFRFFPAQWVAFDALLDYSHSGVSDDAGNDYSVSGWTVSAGLSVFFGGQ